MINRMSAAGAQLFFYAFAALMGLSISSIFLVFTGVSIVQTFLVTADRLRGPVALGLHDQEGHLGLGHRS